MASTRVEKVNSLLQHEIGKILSREISFPDGVLATIARVDTSANLIETKVYVSVFAPSPKPAGEGGPDDMANQVLVILKKNIYDIQQKINKTLKMRPIPKIIFMKDTIESKAGRVEELLAQLKKEEK